MEYKRLIQLDNQYPNLRNYVNNGLDTNILLKGIYYTGDVTNQIQFKLEDLSKVTPVPGTKFRFILSISMNESDTNPKLFTSKLFYDDLKSSYDENNPYLPLAGFNKSFIVNLSYFDLLKLFEGYKVLEETDLVFLHKNIFIDEKSQIDYQSFAEYINWVVDTPNALDFDSAGVKPAETLGVWSTLTLDPATGKAVNKKQAEANQKQAAKDAQIKLLNEELAKLLKDIPEYESAIKQGDYNNIGLSRSQIVVAGTEYTSGSHLLNRSKQNDDIRKALQAKLNELLAKKAQIEKSLADIIGSAPNTGTQQGTAGNVTDLSPADLAKIAEIDKTIAELKNTNPNSFINKITGKSKQINERIQKLEKEKSDIKAKTTAIVKETKPAVESDSVTNYGGGSKKLDMLK